MILHLALRAGMAIGFSLLLTTVAAAVPAVPADFVVENALLNNTLFNNPTAIATLPDGRWLVAEKRGVVWAVTNGVKSAKPMWSATEEVLNSGDRGLIGIAADPAYATNHRVYFFYSVDPDSDGVDDVQPSFGRLVRYQTSATDSNVVDSTTRTVLIGATWRTGIVSASLSHGVDCLRFGEDGSLLVTHGDGAHYEFADAGGRDAEQFGPDRSAPSEDIGSFRALDLASLAGKVLRINPETGHGYASNPYAAGDLSANAAKVWASGFRNPFRFCVRPGTGSADTALGRPGALIVGDVGLNAWEELNVIDRPGMNLGWPCREGRGPQALYATVQPAHHGCATSGPMDDPAILYHHNDSTLSAPYGLMGNCTAGGLFYLGSGYPAHYQGRLFFGDFGGGWLKVATLDSLHRVVHLQDFGANMDGPVDFAIDPQSGDILYVSIYTGQVRRIRYVGGGTGNAPPVAQASATPTVSDAPATITFSSLGSYDPAGAPVTTTWTFGDLSAPSLQSHPVHVYEASGEYSAILTVRTTSGATASDTVKIVIARAGGFPVTGVLDAFGGPDRPLASPWAGSLSGLAIRNAALTQTTSPSYATWSGASYGANQEAYVTFDSVTANAPEHALLLKVQGVSWSSGAIQVVYAASQSLVVVSTYTPGVGWTRRGGPWTVAFGPGDRLGARAFSNGMVVILKNGATLGTASMQTWPFANAGGRIGLKLVGATASRLRDFGGGDIGVDVHTPPRAFVTSPADRSFFVAGDHVLLSGHAEDDEEAAATIDLRWTLDLIHNNHTHPSVFTFTAPVDSFEADDHDDGTGVYYRVNLTATDPVGLTDTTTVSIYPEIDLTAGPVVTSPVYPTPGGLTTYAFTLANHGRMPAHLSRWAIVAGGLAVAHGDTLIPARDSVRIVRTLPTLPAGNYALRAVADTLNGVVEPNEANNASVRGFAVVTFPSTPVLDTFAGLDGPIVSPWVGSLSGFAVNNRALVHVGTSNYAVWNAAVLGADQEAYVRFDSLTVASPEHDLLLKVQGTSWTSGAVQVVYSAALGQLVVNTYTPGSGWLRRAGPWKVLFAPGDQLGARATADGMVRVFKNGAKVGEATLTAWPFFARTGRIGFLLNNAPSSRLRDFGGGTLTAPVATISSPAQRSFFAGGESVVLTGVAEDAQDQAASLTYRWRVERVSPGGVEPAFFTSQARVDSFVTQAAGDFFYRAHLIVTDPAGLSDTATVTIHPEIDLVASPIVTAPLKPTGVGVTSYSFTISNRGRAAAPLSRWAIVANGATLAQGDTMVAALDSVRVTATLVSLAPSSYTLRAVADTLGALTETDESNNAYVTSFTVGEFPSAGPLDTFTRPDGPLVSPWTGSLSGFAISNQALIQTGVTSYLTWNAAVFGANQEAYMRLDSITAASPEHDLLLKVQGANWTSGAIQVTYSAAQSHVVVNTYTPGSGWLRRAGPWKVTFLPGDQLGARATADGMVRVFRNNQRIGEVSLAAWPYASGGGRIGMLLSRANASRIGVFGGGDVRSDSGQTALAVGLMVGEHDSPGPRTTELENAAPAPLETPRVLAVSSAYPNPARGAVTFALELPRAAQVAIQVFDIQGRSTWNAPPTSWSAGRGQVQWLGRDQAGRRAAPGIYLARITVGDQVFTRRVTLNQ